MPYNHCKDKSYPVMSKAVFVGSVLLFASIIVIANYSVQFHILGSPMTYGALTYPLSFLIMDILSEKYSKAKVTKTLWFGLFLAFIPSFFVSEPRIALASVCAFIVSQNLDVYIFFYLKHRFPALWWLRSSSSALLAQFIDTAIFFHIAFLFIKSWEDVCYMILADFAIKAFVCLLDTPIFYAFAIAKIRNPNKTR